MPRDAQFYTEVVVVTTLTILSANIWTLVADKVSQKYFPRSVAASILVATLVSIASIAVLYIAFVKLRKTEEEEEEEKSSKDAKDKPTFGLVANYLESSN